MANEQRDASKNKETLHLVTAYPLASQRRWTRIFLQSMAGILVGMTGGGLLLWWILSDSSPQATKEAAGSQPPHQAQLAKANTPAPQGNRAPSLYAACQAEIKAGQAGAAFTALATQHADYALRWHLEWQLAERLTHREQHAQAAARYEALAKLSTPWLPKGIFVMRQGRALFQAGDASVAKPLLKKGLEMTAKEQTRSPIYRAFLEQESASALWSLASLSEGQEQRALWLKLWTRYPKAPEAWLARQRWEAASPALSNKEARAILQKASFWQGWLWHPQLLGKLNAPTKRQRKKEDPDGQIERFLANQALRRGLWKEALQHTSRLIEEASKKHKAPFLFTSAMIALYQGKISIFRRSIRRIRTDRRYWRKEADLSYLHYLLSQAAWKSAIRFSAKAWRQHRSPADRARINRYLGLAWLARKQAKKARNSFQSALALHQKAQRRSLLDAAEIRYWLAYSQEQSNQSAQAIANYRAILQESPLRPAALLAHERLREIGQPQSLPFTRPPATAWHPKEIADQAWSLLLQTLHHPQQPLLLLLEMERWLLQEKRPPTLPFLEKLMSLAQETPYTDAARQLAARYFRLSPQSPYALLSLLYPAPTSLFPQAQSPSKRDLRPLAALWIALASSNKLPPLPADDPVESGFLFPLAHPLPTAALHATWSAKNNDLPPHAQIALLATSHPQRILALHKNLQKLPPAFLEALYPASLQPLLFTSRLYQLLHLP
jgi:hypothetical protein